MLSARDPKAFIPVLVVLTAAYFVAGKIGLLLAFVHASASAVWPPTGIALAAFLLFGYRVWPGILLGAFLVNLTTAGSALSSLGIAVGNTLEGLVGAYLVNTFANGRHAFDRPQGVFKFAILAAVASTAVSATCGVTSLALTGYARWSNFGPIWLTWWLGDAGGALIVTPLLILWGTHLPQGLWHRGRVLEMAALLLALGVTGLGVFAGFHPWSAQHYPLEFLTFPVLVWAAFRFGPRETATAIALLSALAIWGTVRGFGPFAMMMQNASLLLLQAFMSVAAVMSLALAAAVQERQRAEGALRATAEDNAQLYREAQAQRQRLLTVLEQTPEAVAMVAATTGRVTLVNNMAQQLWPHPQVGWTLTAAWPRIPTKHLDGTPYVLSDLPISRALRGEVILGEEVVVERPDATSSILLVNAAPVVDQDGHITEAVCVYQDITQRKTLEQLKDEFLSVAAHELKTPLTAIKGNSQLLLRQFNPRRPMSQEMQSHILQTIDERTTYVVGLVNELLDLSRIETGRLQLHPEPIDLAGLLQDVVGQQQLLHPDYRFVLEGGGVVVRGMWDRGRLEQVFTNLLDNAAKYSPAGATVMVQLTLEPGYAHLTVRDQGIGIPPQDLPHLFERHFRASNVDPARSGLGLGLYITLSIVQRHDGRIWAESVEGEGSVFHVLLPLEVSP